MNRTEVAFKPYMVEVFTTYKTEAAAQAVADKLNAEDEDWTYKVEPTKAGTFLVVTYDEDGYCLGPL